MTIYFFGPEIEAEFSATSRARTRGRRLTGIGVIPYATDAYCFGRVSFLHQPILVEGLC